MHDKLGVPFPEKPKPPESLPFTEEIWEKLEEKGWIATFDHLGL
jgi:hypothetical protein